VRRRGGKIHSGRGKGTAFLQREEARAIFRRKKHLQAQFEEKFQTDRAGSRKGTGIRQLGKLRFREKPDMQARGKGKVGCQYTMKKKAPCPLVREEKYPIPERTIAGKYSVGEETNDNSGKMVWRGSGSIARKRTDKPDGRSILLERKGSPAMAKRKDDALGARGTRKTKKESKKTRPRADMGTALTTPKKKRLMGHEGKLKKKKRPGEGYAGRRKPFYSREAQDEGDAVVKPKTQKKKKKVDC